MRLAIAGGATHTPMLRAGDVNAVRAELEVQCDQLRSRLALLDRKLDASLDAAAQGRVHRDKLRKDATALARERLTYEEELAEAEARLRRQSDLREREQRRARDLDEIVTRWDILREEQRRTLLRDVVDRIDVDDDAIRVHLRP